MTEAAEDTRRRGRPRPQETLERDDRALASLREGAKTTEELAAALGVEKSIAYLSVYRLKRDGRIVPATEGRNKWTVAAAT